MEFRLLNQSKFIAKWNNLIKDMPLICSIFDLILRFYSIWQPIWAIMALSLSDKDQKSACVTIQYILETLYFESKCYKYRQNPLTRKNKTIAKIKSIHHQLILTTGLTLVARNKVKKHLKLLETRQI